MSDFDDVHQQRARGGVMIAYHLTTATLRDGRPLPPIGEILRHDGPVVPCRQGLHASVRLLDALSYAPAAARWLHRVEVGGAVVEHDGDKVVASERTILQSWPLDLRRVVRLACEAAALAAWCAGRYDERLIAAAEAADRGDWQACETAAWAAARSAGDAAGAAMDVWAAARAARAAARAAWAAGAAGDAAGAAGDAARAAAGDAWTAWDAAGAAGDAAMYAARECLGARAVVLLTGGAS